MARQRTEGESEDDNDGQPGLGCGIFLVLGGLLALAEELGWIKGVSWVPVLFIALGAHYIYQALRKK